MRSLFRTIAKQIAALHPLTWCVATLVAAALVLMVVPGERWHESESDSDTWLQRECEVLSWLSRCDARESHVLYQHGWPLLWLMRTLPENDPSTTYDAPRTRPLLVLEEKPGNFLSRGTLSYVAWSSLDNWPFLESRVKFYPGRLALNVAVDMLILAIVAAGTQFWVYRRGGRVRLKVFDLLGATTLCALGLGWYTYHARLQYIESHGLGDTNAEWRSVGGPNIEASRRYCGPVWLEKLVGSPEALPWFSHVQEVEIWDGDNVPKNLLDDLPRWTYVDTVAIYSDFPSESFAMLAKCGRLRRLELNSLDFPEVNLSPTTGRRLFSIYDLDLVSKLKVKEIVVEGAAVLVQDIEKLASMPGLECLHLEYPGATLDEINDVQRRYPNLRVSIDWNSRWRDPAFTPPGEQPAHHAEFVAERKRERELADLSATRGD